jgi:hypothetical protein
MAHVTVTEHGWGVVRNTPHVGDGTEHIVRWSANCTCGWNGPERIEVTAGSGRFACGRGTSRNGKDMAAEDGLLHVRAAA